MSVSKEELLAQAEAWGFICSLDERGESVIMPQDGSWRIVSRSETKPSGKAGDQNLGNGDRWLLMVRGSSQISFYPEDVLKFLRRRRSTDLD